MTLRVNTMAEYEALKKRNIKATIRLRPGKFNAVICEADNMHFPSKKHRSFYLGLQAQKKAGMLKFFLREVAFDLPGHYDNGKIVRHFVDFGICQNDDTFRWVEVKGRDLAMGKLKRKQVEEIYGIRIEVI